MPLPDPVRQQMAAIEALIAERAWDEVEVIVGRLPELIEALSEAERGPALLALGPFLDSLAVTIRSASDEVASELGALRNGRKAAGSYRDCAALPAFDVSQDM